MVIQARVSKDMANLFFVSIEISSVEHEVRAAIWRLVVDLSISQGADSFSIEPTLERKRSPEPVGLSRLLAQPVDANGLRSISSQLR